MPNLAGVSPVLLLTSPNKAKRQWVIDMCGAQYGFSRVCWDWQEYNKNHMSAIRFIKDFGGDAELVGRMATLEGYPILLHGVAGEATKQLDEGIAAWEKENAMKLSELGGLEKADFQEYKTLLLEKVDEVMEEYVAGLDLKKVIAKNMLYETMNLEVSKDRVEWVTGQFRRWLHSRCACPLVIN